MEASSQLTLYGTTWCGASRRVRLFLESHSIPFTWVDIDIDPPAARRVEELNHGCQSVPTLVWPDGSVMVEPSNERLAEKLGVPL